MPTGGTDKFDKGIFVDKLRRAFGTGLVGADGDFHRRQRRMIRPAFHRRPLTRYSATMTALVAEPANSCRDGQVPALDRVMRDSAITVVGRTPFSADFGPRRGGRRARRPPPAARRRLVPVPGAPVRPEVIGLLHPNRLPMTARRRSAP